MEIEAKFPQKLAFLFSPHRYKVARGGRGSGKSWSFARAALIQGAERPLRWICAREVQKSIKESVHQLLSDQIKALNLSHFYQVLETEIRGLNGTTFSFAGLAQHTVDSIKSFEGADRVWVEEAHSVSKKSWDVLLPTIRRDGSEIWVSFNPELDTDETYKRFVVNPPPDCVSVLVNWRDNPWFPEVLEQERLHCLKTNPDDYDVIWEGSCRSAVVGAIYAKEMEAALRDSRIGFFPYEPRLKVHVVFDLGWNDAMFISFVQRHISGLRVIDCIKDSHRTLDSYAIEIRDRKYNLGKTFLPHDGFHRDYKTGKTAAEILKSMGFKQVRQVPNETLENGIKSARMTLAQTLFHKPKTEPLIDSLKRYRRAVNSATNEPGAPLHDDASHGSDNYRYISLCAEQMTNDEEEQQTIQAFEPFDAVMGC